MAIDMFKEEVISFAEAARRLPRRRAGRKPHVSVLYRWAKDGLRSQDGMEVRLETIQVGGTKCTSLEALQRFFDRLTGDTTIVYPPRQTIRQREAAIRRAEERLEAAGW